MSTQTSDGKPAHKPTVFIGSSTEGLPVARSLIRLLGPAFKVRLWRNVFVPGSVVIEVLRAELTKAQAAVLIFTEDDKREFRDRVGLAARDNVVLEFGFFVSGFGRDRAWILAQDGVEVPSDIFGITLGRFPSRNPDNEDDADYEGRLEAELDKFVSRLQEAWKNLSPQPASIQDAGLGFAVTLQSEQSHLTGVTERLGRYAAAKTLTDGPIVLASPRSALSAYAEALDRVSERFWTTTFLDSKFWTGTDPLIIAANQSMMARLHAKGEARGAARRLFLLDQEPQQVAQSYKADRVQLRQLDKDAEQKAKDVELRNLRRNVERMTADGFDVKVAYDRDQAYRNLRLPDLEDLNRSELAIYDSFRVDVFEGGSSGVNLVRSFNPAIRMFDVYLNRSVAYFEWLWAAAEPVGSLLDQIDQAIVSAELRIDYASNWLARYEFNLDPNDTELKTVEVKRVEEILRDESERRWGKVERYLDIGTCTGRYPLRLREAVTADGTIIGIDEDWDCVMFARMNVEQECPHDSRIEIRQTDFTVPGTTLGESYDLITCMLGTLSHFGWDRAEDGRRPFNDTLQASLSRMAGLLTDSGLLLLGTWSEYACENRAMLDIYRESDRKRLANWTPGPIELQARLLEAGLRIVSRASPERRLDLLVCTPC